MVSTRTSELPGVRPRLGLVAGPVLAIALTMMPAPADLSPEAWRVAAIGLLMATWWITEAIPIPATALLPLALFPIGGISDIKTAASPYANPVIFLFLGGFLLALSMQRWGLHRRVALGILGRIGTEPNRVVGGFMVATALLSSAVSNTATTVMMIPLAVSVLEIARKDSREDPERLDRFGRALVLGIAYAASIGGIATLIGTPPNALFAGFMLETYGFEIGFARWMIVGVPLSVLLLPIAWLVLTRGPFRSDLRAFDTKGDLLRREQQSLGPLSRGERITAVVFASVAVLWMVRPLLARIVPGLSDAGIAVLGGVILFAIPVDLRRGLFVMDWKTARAVPWDVLLLFGGGLSLAGAVSRTGLAEWIGQSLTALEAMPLILLMIAIAAMLVFLTELTSNTASTAAFLPVVASIAAAIGQNAVYLLVPAVVGASCAFMLPVATPPNAIAYGSGLITVPQMARAGIVLNLLFLLLIPLVAYVTVGVAFQAVPGVIPEWMAGH